jgi:hypothetical protein
MSVSLDFRGGRDFGSRGDAVVNDFENLFALDSGKRKARRADPFGAKSAFLDGELDVLNEFDVDIKV